MRRHRTGRAVKVAAAGDMKDTAAASWDWSGIVGTGQSLSVGTTPVTSTTQPYGNLKLSLGPAGNAAVPPYDPVSPALALVPLVEPIRPIVRGFPNPYPGNIYGETPHTAMANEISARAKAASPSTDHVTVHTVVGETGQGIAALLKQTGSTIGITGRAYAATLFEVAAVARLARAAGKTYGVAAIVMTHGETDNGSAEYGDWLVALLADYNADIAAVTGQTRRIPMYLSQQHAYPHGPGSRGMRPVINQAQWRLAIDRPIDFACTGPKYQYPGDADGVHLTSQGYTLFGEKAGQVYFEREVLGRDWRPLHPTRVDRRAGRAVTVHFHVPVRPLAWESAFDAPAIRAFARGRGFELRTASADIPIASVEIAGDAVVITADADLPTTEPLFVGYALASQGVQLSVASRAVRWGTLRDSDPFVGTTTGLPNPNYGVSFELPVP